jgi:hypothetical protein
MNGGITIFLNGRANLTSTMMKALLPSTPVGLDVISVLPLAESVSNLRK